jgi:hypothetical protein
MSDPSQSPSEGRRSESVLGPFTVRDLTLFGGALITFVASLLPLFTVGPGNLWNAVGLYFLGIGLLAPVAAAALFAWRRIEPARKLRVGSLSVDQFASVTAILSAAFYFLAAVTVFSPAGVVGLLGGLAMLAATTLARLIPQFAVDFEGRPEVPAHIVARDAVPPVPRPKPAAVDQPGKASPAAGAVPAAAAPQAATGTGAEGLGVGAGAAAAAAAVGAAAWSGHTDDGAWGSAPADFAPGVGEAADAPGSGPGVPAESFGEVPAAAPAAASHAGDDAERPQPAEVGAADLLAPEQAMPEYAAEDAVGETPAEGPVPVGSEASRSAPAEDATRREEAPAESTIGSLGAADGEAYGAPEPLAQNAAAPATAVFPASNRQSAPDQPPPTQAAPAQAAPTQATPAQTAPAQAAPGSGVPNQAAPAAGSETEAAEDIGATAPYDDGSQYEAFWFAVSQPRNVVDPSTGQPAFGLEPGQWILALQDRGYEFVVQSPDGRVGVLRELAGIERA